MGTSPDVSCPSLSTELCPWLYTGHQSTWWTLLLITFVYVYLFCRSWTAHKVCSPLAHCSGYRGWGHEYWRWCDPRPGWRLEIPSHSCDDRWGRWQQLKQVIRNWKGFVTEGASVWWPGRCITLMSPMSGRNNDMKGDKWPQTRCNLRPASRSNHQPE